MKSLKYIPMALGLFAICGLLSFSSQIEVDKTLKKGIKRFEKAYPGFAYIPGGYFMPSGTDESLSEGLTPIVMSSIEPFWMSKYEVSNAQWREFVKDIRLTYPGDSFKKLLPDTNLWTQNGIVYNEPIRRYYYRHPAYSNYPVTNVTYSQCEAYCRWLQSVMASRNLGVDSVVVRLPTDEEWEFAAHGENPARRYPWGEYVNNSKGIYLANFWRVPAENIRRDGGKLVLVETHQEVGPASIPAPVNMYSSTDYGLYNMGGNVSEFVSKSTTSPGLEGAFSTTIGITRGGSFFDPPYYMQCSVRDFYQADSSAHFSRGFRPVVTFKLARPVLKIN